MNGITRVVLSVTLALGSLAMAPVAAQAATSCGQAPDGLKTYWRVTNVSKTTQSTGVASDWVWPQHGPANITGSVSDTAEVNASFSVSVGAEAGVIFAKASVEAGVTVGGSWSSTKSWSYAFDVPKDAVYEYRVIQLHSTRTFLATQYRWQYTASAGKCTYSVYKKSTVEAPVTSSSNVWTTQKRKH